MKKTKIVLLAVVLIAAGLVLAAAGLWIADFDFSKLSSQQLTANTYHIDEDFSKISIDTEISNVELALAEDGTCQVWCLEEVNYFHKVSVENGTLTISTQDNRKWYEHVGVNITDFHSITVWLPKQVYEALTVTCTTADVKISKDFRFDRADLSTTTGDIRWLGSGVDTLSLAVTTGDISVKDTLCNTLSAKTTTGDIRLYTSGATKQLQAQVTAGDVRFDRFNAPEMTVKTTTGDVTGTLLSNKTFLTHTTTGSVQTPDPSVESGPWQLVSSAGKVLSDAFCQEGTCEITTTTGNIRIDLA
jgi:hypothetical protein